MARDLLRALAVLAILTVGLIRAATTTPVRSGEIVFAHDYSGATAPNYRWSWGTTIEPPLTLSVVSNGFAAGVPSARITAPPGANSAHAEGLTKWPLVEGQDLYWGLAVKFDSPWGEPSPDGWGAAIAQLYYQACVNHTWGLFAHANDVRFVLLSGRQTLSSTGAVTRGYNNSDGGPQGPSPRIISGIVPDRWYRIIAEIRSAYDDTGLTRIWVKDPDASDYELRADVENVPTLQYGQCYSGNAIGFDDWNYHVSQKFGYYTGSRTTDRTFEEAAISAGTTFDAVKARLDR